MVVFADNIRPDDVALVAEVRFFEQRNAGAGHPTITCKSVYECSNFTVTRTHLDIGNGNKFKHIHRFKCYIHQPIDPLQITVFFLPPGAAMPLHNHPGLTVFSKLLVGSARVVAYDWVRPLVCSGSGSAGSTMMLAEKVLDQEFTVASGAWVLFPDSGGNMHRFVAGEDGPCAFLDVITPSYSPEKQGLCAFYQDCPYDLHPGN